MYNPSICLDIIARAKPESVSRIKSYATLYTCQLWAEYQTARALDRMYACPKADAWTARLHYLDRATKANEMAAAFSDAINQMERPRPGECSKDWRKRRKVYHRMTEIIRRHWDDETGLFKWGRATYGL